MSNVHYIPGRSKFVRGQWRVWCYDATRQHHYWGFPGDENIVPHGSDRKFRKVPDEVFSEPLDVLL